MKGVKRALEVPASVQDNDLVPRTRHGYIGIDLGGTKTLGLLLDEADTVLARTVTPTDASGNEAVQAGILDVLRWLTRKAAEQNVEVTAIGVGAPGFIDADLGVMADASNLQVRNLPLVNGIESALGLPAVLVHDVRAAALAEGRVGAARGAKNFVYINVGTGIAAGFVFDGVLYAGDGGRAGEIGHVVLRANGPLCSCGKRGCLEALASGPAIERAAWAALNANPTSLLAHLARTAAHRALPQELTPKSDDLANGGIMRNLAEAAEAGDDAAQTVLGGATGHLGRVIAWLVDSLAPERVIIGGGVALLGTVFLEPLARAAKARTLETNWHPGLITAGELKGNAGAIGAALAARHRFGNLKEAQI